MTLYEEMIEMLEEEYAWMIENSTTDEDEYNQYLDSVLGDDRYVQYALKGSYFFDYNVNRYIYDLDEVAIAGKVFVLGAGLVYINPTRRDLCMAAEAIIHNMADYHHIYLESYIIKNETDNVKYCELLLGS